MSDRESEDEDDYLSTHPENELALWEDWVKTACEWAGISSPTFEEFERLKAQWFPGQTPVESVDILKRMRTSA